jgi:hypothetical protein
MYDTVFEAAEPFDDPNKNLRRLYINSHTQLFVVFYSTALYVFTRIGHVQVLIVS